MWLVFSGLQVFVIRGGKKEKKGVIMIKDFNFSLITADKNEEAVHLEALIITTSLPTLLNFLIIELRV